MKLHTVFITYNRLHLTKQAIESYLQTVKFKHTYVVVDNCSTDGTQDWLSDEGHPRLLLDRNYYPGYACNRGWEQAPRSASHLQRADNDMAFLPVWCAEVNDRFRKKRRLGQLGLRTDAEENHVSFNTGGNCIIQAQLFSKGLRYDERPWRSYKPGLSEDTFFSPAVRRLGYQWDRVRQPCLESLAPDMRDPAAWKDPYYKKSYGDRRIRRRRRVR